jgi:hypothetical protein
MGVCASRGLTWVLFYLPCDVERLFGEIDPGLFATPSPLSHAKIAFLMPTHTFVPGDTPRGTFITLLESNPVVALLTAARKNAKGLLSEVA